MRATRVCPLDTFGRVSPLTCRRRPGRPLGEEVKPEAVPIFAERAITFEVGIQQPCQYS